MKHQYFGDVNDYRKYGLLRSIQRETGFRLGVCWMLTSNDTRTDGKFISYLLEPARWRRYDPALFDALSQAVVAERHLRHVEELSLLPGAVLFDRIVPQGRDLRSQYFQAFFDSTRGCDLVFFDPDNGILVPSCGIGSKEAPKYIAWDELATTYRTGRSVLLYQHFPRKPRDLFVRELSDQLLAQTGCTQVTCFRTANVGFFLACQPHHADLLSAAADQIGRNWKGQIEVSTLGGRSDQRV